MPCSVGRRLSHGRAITPTEAPAITHHDGPWPDIARPDDLLLGAGQPRVLPASWANPLEQVPLEISPAVPH